MWGVQHVVPFILSKETVSSWQQLKDILADIAYTCGATLEELDLPDNLKSVVVLCTTAMTQWKSYTFYNLSASIATVKILKPQIKRVITHNVKNAQTNHRFLSGLPTRVTKCLSVVWTCPAPVCFWLLSYFCMLLCIHVLYLLLIYKFKVLKNWVRNEEVAMNNKNEPPTRMQ